MTRALMRFHRLGRALLAPNLELVAWLEKQTGKPAFLMPRGIDTDLFHPRRRAPRDAGGEPDVVRLGFVGRLSSEKNVELLAAVERELIRAGLGNYRFLIVGDGSQRAWLGANLQRADFTGLLRGEDLARAYASMDVFLFPSRTDSFGNVIAEALASGTPCVVTNQGGPQYQVREGITGVIAASDEAFVASARGFVENPGRARAMRAAAREAALGKSWAAAFDPVWNVYQAVALTESATKRQPVLAQPALSVATPATVTKPETTIKPAAAKAAAA